MKSGTAADEGAPAAEETIAGVVAGSTQASNLGIKAVRSTDALAETGAAGSGTESDEDGSTQQHVLLGV